MQVDAKQQNGMSLNDYDQNRFCFLSMSGQGNVFGVVFGISTGLILKEIRDFEINHLCHSYDLGMVFRPKLAHQIA
jgi:hypothetical protein